MEGDGGEFMEVTFKAAWWEKEHKMYEYIFYAEGE